MIISTRLKKYLEHLPLIALAVITSVGFFGVYYLWAHPASQGTPVDVGSGPIQNPYYYNAGELPDLDNCPGGPNAQPCHDQFGVQISCYNPDQNDGDFDLLGDICDPDTAIGPPPSTCIDDDHDNYGNPGSPDCSGGPEEDCNNGDQNINPGVPENCANPAADNNCNGLKGCNDTSPNGCPSCTGGRICSTTPGPDINTCVFPPEICNDGGRVDEDGDGKANCADDQCHNQLGENGKLCCGLLSGASVVPDDSVCGACKACSAGSLECNNQSDGITGNACNTQCTQCVGGACLPYGLGNAGECPVGKVCNGAVPPVCVNKPEDCTNGIDDDADGPTDCADSECFGQTGPDPDGAGPLPAGKCCFNQGVVPPTLEVGQCGTCEACVGSPTYQCRAQTAENGNSCVGACTMCSAAQPLVCVNRPAGVIGDPSGPCTGMGLCDGAGSCTDSCGNSVLNNPPESCDPTAPQQGLPGQTTGPAGNYRAFQESDQCLSCGAVGSAGECLTLRYLNCADGTINDDDFIPLPIKPTKYLWTTGWNGGSHASVSQIVALPNAIPKPGGGFYNAGDIVHEYRICDKGSGVASARYYAVDIKTPGADCNAGDSEVLYPRHVAVNNDDANNTEAWVTFSSDNFNYHGVALFSEQAGLIKFCRSKDANDDGIDDAEPGPFYPHGVAVDRQGNAWVGGGAGFFAGPQNTAVLRKYGRSSSCAMLSEIRRTNSNWGALSWLMTISPNGDLWSTTYQDGLVAYVGQPDSPNPTILSNVGQTNYTILQPRGIISDRNGNAIVATNNNWSPIRRYKSVGGVLTYDDLPSGIFQLQAVSFDIYKASQTPRPSYLWSSQYTGAIRIFDRNGNPVYGPQSLLTDWRFTLALASDGYVWTTFSNSRQVCQYDFRPATPTIVTPPACYPGASGSITSDLSGGDFTGGHRSLIFGEEVGYLPRLSDAPLTALDAAAPNGSWNHRWGKVVYQQVSTFGSARVYVCLSDTAADLNDSCGGSATGWVLATNYNSDYTNIIYRKKYLRLKVIKNVGVQIQGLKVGCLDGGSNVCN